MDGNKYTPLIENAEKEKSAVGKCKWIISMFKILATNDLTELHDGINQTNQKMRKMFWLAVIILVLLLSQNPTILVLVAKLALLF